MAMMMATSMVATRTNATGNGPYFAPSHSDRNTPTTNWTKTATSGDFHRGWMWVKIDGKSRMRPIAYHVRVVALAAALELAMAELAMARKTSTQPAPQTLRARKSHGLPPPTPAKPPNLDGPKYTTAAYVVRT